MMLGFRMAKAVVKGMRIAGIAAAVPGPSKAVTEDSLLQPEELSRITRNSGVSRRHLVSGGVCTSDLCLAAANRLLDATGWTPDSIDGLLFVSQTPDYVLPATACSLHHRLGLSRSCLAFDVNLGCSGYVYGLWLAGSIMSGNSVSRVILLAGDTISRLVSPEDRSVATLFGDAGTATALEFDAAATPMFFELGTDGAGSGHLAVRAGGFRIPKSAETCVRSQDEKGNIRSDEDLYMDGGEVLAFTLSTVPDLCRSVLEQAGWSIATVDSFVMHQANRFMVQNLAKIMSLPKEKVVLALENYGNTSSASIPLAMIEALSGRLAESTLKLLLAGFGVGFSWAAATLECGPMIIPPIVRTSAIDTGSPA